MPPVVVVANGASFSVCDLGAVPPTATVVTPPPTPNLPAFTGEGCTIAAIPNRVAAGRFPAGVGGVGGTFAPYEVHLYDVSTPTAPTRLATKSVPSLRGSAALAINGPLVAVAEMSSSDVFLIDFSVA